MREIQTEGMGGGGAGSKKLDKWTKKHSAQKIEMKNEKNGLQKLETEIEIKKLPVFLNKICFCGEIASTRHH